MNKYNIISEGEHPLKIDKDMQELQKTIIYYGEQIIKELDKITTLLRTIIQTDHKEEKAKEKLKAIEPKDMLIKRETSNSHDRAMKVILDRLNKLEYSQ